jgi:hypothetical protein
MANKAAYGIAARPTFRALRAIDRTRELVAYIRGWLVPDLVSSCIQWSSSLAGLIDRSGFVEHGGAALRVSQSENAYRYAL